MGINKTVTEAAQILKYLYTEDFKAKSVLNISAEFSIPLSTVYRILQSWKQAGFVIETPSPKGKGVLWQVSNELVSIAFAYKHHVIDKVQSTKDEYKSVSGQELKL